MEKSTSWLKINQFNMTTYLKKIRQNFKKVLYNYFLVMTKLLLNFGSFGFLLYY